MKRTGVENGPAQGAKGSDKILHFEQFEIDGRFHGGKQAAMIDGAQGVDFSLVFGHDTIGVRGFGGFEEPFQEGRAHLRHIAGDENIPFGLCREERRVQAADGSTILDGIGKDRQTKMDVLFDGSNERDIASGAADLRGDFLHHGRRPERQQGFIAAHAPAGSPDQNESRARHEMMVATSGHLVVLNKLVYICCLMAIAMLAASPSRAADVSSAISVPAPAIHKTQVVRTDPRTGKLVRSVVERRDAKATSSSAELNALVEKAAKAHQVDPLLVHSVIQVESNYNVRAVSNKGAQGLMQLTPSTAKMLGVSDSFDPQQNIEAGVKYLKYLKDLYKDDRLALAAYNAGPGAVDKYKKQVPPYAETQSYVEQVGKRYGEARRAADAVKKPAPAQAAVPEKVMEEKPVEPAKVEQFIDADGRLHLKTAQ